MNATENSANPVIEKANKIHHEGVDAINEGRAPLFTWPEDLGLRYNASMYFDWSCGDALFEPVLIPILVAMEKNQVSLINVGIHFQTHSTLCEAKHPENVPPAPFSFTPSTSLVGHVIEFSEFVIGHNTLLMAASDIPPEIMDARTELESLYLEMGLVPMPIQNL